MFRNEPIISTDLFGLDTLLKMARAGIESRRMLAGEVEEPHEEIAENVHKVLRRVVE